MVTTFFIKRHGEFHGMCSEICGVLHGFTPYTLNDSQYRACTGLGGVRSLIHK